jgi:hypothetical protein
VTVNEVSPNAPATPPGPSLGERAAAAVDWLRTRLSSQSAIAAMVLVSACGLVLAAYVAVAQYNQQDCQARYNELSAKSQAARSAAATEDRAADRIEREINEKERTRLVANEDALDTVLIAMGTDDRSSTEQAFIELLSVRAETARMREANGAQRALLAAQRARTEENRRRSPVPDPPSEMCA